jgi:hypothetical protein
MSQNSNQRSAHLAPNLLHKTFEMVSFVDKLPLTIESITCYDTFFILGTSSGRMLVYEVKSNPMSPMKLEASFEKSVAVTKKPIQQLQAVKEFKILIALFDAQLHVFDLDKFQLQNSIIKTKGCSLFATSIASDENLLRLVVACKRKLMFFYLNTSNSKFMEFHVDLELADVPRTLELTRDNLVVFSLRKEFFYHELPSSTVNAVGASNKQPEAKFTTGNRTLEPICEKLYNDYFVVGVDENKTILYDSKGSFFQLLFHKL